MFMISNEQGVHRIVLNVGFDCKSVVGMMRRLVCRGPVRLDLGRLRQFSLCKFMALCQTFEELKSAGADLEWANVNPSVQTLLVQLNHSIALSGSRLNWVEANKNASGCEELGDRSASAIEAVQLPIELRAERVLISSAV